jgi:ribosome assembly protein 4
VKLFDGKSGKFMATLGKVKQKSAGMHMGPVYRLAWSADSRKILSGSSDATVKVWEITHHKLVKDLPGHADEVYGVDWSPTASGGKDQIVRLWQ